MPSSHFHTETSGPESESRYVENSMRFYSFPMKISCKSTVGLGMRVGMGMVVNFLL